MLRYIGIFYLKGYKWLFSQKQALEKYQTLAKHIKHFVKNFKVKGVISLTSESIFLIWNMTLPLLSFSETNKLEFFFSCYTFLFQTKSRKKILCSFFFAQLSSFHLICTLYQKISLSSSWSYLLSCSKLTIEIPDQCVELVQSYQ